MGKGKSVASASDGNALKKQPGAWVKSAVTERSLNLLRKEGQLPPEKEGKVRHTGGEVIPRPRKGERVVFVDYDTRGFSFPIHDFVRGLLYAYGIQLHHFTPNTILQIACFITLCECFLGVHPHWGLWKRLFFVKRQTVKNTGGCFAVEGLSVQVRGDVE